MNTIKNSDKQAPKEIRFIDSCYNDLFSLPDGGNVVLTNFDGKISKLECRYIDEYHAQIGSRVYHICEFAEIMERNGAKYEPEQDAKKLLDLCYSILPTGGDLIIIKLNETGYYHYDYSTSDENTNRRLADELNGRMGISKAQEEAMLAGSIFGWQVPAADPSNYNESGEPVINHPDYTTESEDDFSTQSYELEDYEDENEYDEEI